MDGMSPGLKAGTTGHLFRKENQQSANLKGIGEKRDDQSSLAFCAEFREGTGQGRSEK